MPDVVLEQGEQIEDLQFAGLRFIQSKHVLKFGTDSILLSSFVEVRQTERLVEFGTGSGILPVLLAGRAKAEIIGIETQPAAAALARKNAALNGLSNVTILEGDLRQAVRLAGHADVVVMNPPYDKMGSGGMYKREAEQIARREVLCTLEDIMKSASAVLSQGGRLYLIHRSARLAEVLYTMKKHRLEPKIIRPVSKRQGAEPRYVLIKGVKGAKEGMRLLPNLIIAGEDGAYTDEMKKIYHMKG